MKLFATGLCLMSALAVAGMAQQASPAKDTSVTINGKKIGIAYHAPSVKGRHFFGGAGAIQPDDTVWRMGANQATALHTDATLDIGGVTVAPGDYTLYIFLDKGKWQLIVSTQTGQWGIKQDGSTTLDAAKEVGRAPMTMSKPAATVELCKITLSDEGGNKGKLAIEWENVAASVAFSVK